MQEPKVALLDEVAAGVHPRLRQIMLDAIRTLRDAGTTFLIIEHDMELAQDICDRIIVMDAGKIVAQGSFEEISHDPARDGGLPGGDRRVSTPSTDTAVSVVTVEDLDAGYGSVQILHQVSMTARTGDVTCVFGPNGCGKSTLLKAMAGVIDPWAGTVTLDDDDLTHLPSHRTLGRGIAMMPQGGGVFPASPCATTCASAATRSAPADSWTSASRSCSTNSRGCANATACRRASSPAASR